jgi:hypothetical protein
MTSCSQIVRVPNWSAIARYWPPSENRIWSMGVFSPCLFCGTASSRTDRFVRTSREGTVMYNRRAEPYTSSGALVVGRTSAVGGAKAIVPWLDQFSNLALFPHCEEVRPIQSLTESIDMMFSNDSNFIILRFGKVGHSK